MTAGWSPAGDRQLRFGLAGLGSMGRNHLRVVETRDGCGLAAVADPIPELLDDAVSKTDAAGFADPLEMLASVELDAVVIAAPTTAHLDIALAAIERGIAVLVEKPLAASVEEGLRIVAAARERGVPVQVGHVERFNPAVLELGRLLDAGWLSTVYSIQSRRAGPFPARIRDVGVTIDLATHDVDILSWIAGERPERVYAETAQRIHSHHEDLLFGLLHFPSGATGMLDVDWLTPAKRRQLIVVGEEGMFELDYLTQRLTFTKAPDVAHPRLIAPLTRPGRRVAWNSTVALDVIGSAVPPANQPKGSYACRRGARRCRRGRLPGLPPLRLPRHGDRRRAVALAA
jgi:predicted dehydrogenase